MELLKDEVMLAARKVMYYYTRVLAASGLLRLTNKRLVFTPEGRLDKSFGAKEVVIPLRRVTGIAYRGAVRARLVVRTDSSVHTFLDRKAAADFLHKAEEAIAKAAAVESSVSGSRRPTSTTLPRRSEADEETVPEVELSPHEGEVLLVGNPDFFGVKMERIVEELAVGASCVGGAEEARGLFPERIADWSLVVVSLLAEPDERLAFVRDVAASSRTGTLPVWLVEPLFEKLDPEPLWSLGVNVFLDKATSPNEVSDLLNELLRGDATPAQRRHLQRSVHFPVELRHGETRQEVYARAVGRSSIFLQLEGSLRLGAEVSLRFRVPGSERVLDLDGEVVYTRPGRTDADVPAGIGIKYRDLSSEDRDLIELYISRLPYKVNEQSVVFGL